MQARIFVRWATAALGLALAVSGCGRPSDVAAPSDVPDSEAILGKWKVTAAERYLKPFAEPIGLIWDFTEEGVSFYYGESVEDPSPYKIDATRSPKEFELGRKENPRSQHGIYAIDGDTLRLCLGSWKDPPVKAFATDRFIEIHLLTMKRVRD